MTRQSSTETRYCTHCQKNTAHQITIASSRSLQRCLNCFRGRDLRDARPAPATQSPESRR